MDDPTYNLETTEHTPLSTQWPSHGLNPTVCTGWTHFPHSIQQFNAMGFDNLHNDWPNYAEIYMWHQKMDKNKHGTFKCPPGRGKESSTTEYAWHMQLLSAPGPSTIPTDT